MTIRIQFSKKAVILLLLSAALLHFTTAGGSDNAGAGMNWENISTRYVTILYQDDADLHTFLQKIQPRRAAWSFKQLFSRTEQDNLYTKVSKDVDMLFERVQEILDMHKKMPRVAIMIYPDKKELHRAYEDIYQEKCRIRAWYRYSNNAVYVTAADIKVGMLAHELAHAIIDHYLVIKPPAASAEILARYVDSHLQQ